MNHIKEDKEDKEDKEERERLLKSDFVQAVLPFLIRKYEIIDLQKLRVFASSLGSVVIIYNNYVFQCFYEKDVPIRIKFFFDKLNKIVDKIVNVEPNVEPIVQLELVRLLIKSYKKLWNKKRSQNSEDNKNREKNNIEISRVEDSLDITLIYGTFDYIVRLEDIIFFTDRTTDRIPILLWEKIVPLNSYSEEQKKEFVKQNLYKLLWDIGKALTTIHKRNYVHGDPTIDNIGIKNGNLCLFDFDASKVIGNKIEEDDYRIFEHSIQYHMVEYVFFNFASDVSFFSDIIRRVSVARGNLKFIDTLKFLESLKLNTEMLN